MFVLKEVLKKDPKSLTDEEKAFVGENWDLLNDDLRAKFADAEPEAPEGGEEDDDEEGIDEKALQELVEKAAAKNLDATVERIAKQLVGNFEKQLVAQRKRFIESNGKDVNGKSKEADEETRKFMYELMADDREALTKRKAMDTTSDASGADAGYLIPDVLANEVMRLTETQYGTARRLFAYHRLTTGNSKRITALGSTLSVYWIDEGNKITSSQPSFSIVTLALKKLAVITPMTEEVLEDSGVNLTQLVAQLIREAMDKEEDMQFINGDGTAWTGIFGGGNHTTTIPSDALAATKVNSDVRPEDIIALADNINSGALNNARYLMHRTWLSRIRTMRQNADGTGDYLYNPLGGAGQFGTINGFPVELSDAAPTYASAAAADKPCIMFGDFATGAAYGEKADIRFKLLDQATVTDVDGSTSINLAEQDMLAIRAIKRTGYKTTLPAAMRRLVTGPAS